MSLLRPSMQTLEPLGVLVRVLLAASALTGHALAVEPDLETIMGDPDWIGTAPEDAWFDSRGDVFFRQKLVGEAFRGLRRLPLDGAGDPPAPQAVSLAEEARWEGADAVLDRRRRWLAWTVHGDLFVRALPDGVIRQLTRSPEREHSPMFLDGAPVRVAFLREDRVMVRDVLFGLEYEPVPLRFEEDPETADADPESPVTATQWLDAEQERLFESIDDERAALASARARERSAQRLDPTRAPRPLYLGEERELDAISLSPSGRHALVVLRPTGEPPVEDAYARYVTEDGYTGTPSARTLVGTSAAAGETALLIDIASGAARALELRDLPGIDEDPLKRLRAAQSLPELEGLRTVRFGGSESIHWSPDGARLFLTIYSTDHKDRWLVLIDPDDEDMTVVHHYRDPAWIGWNFNEAGWLADGSGVWFLSEDGGHAQLLLHELERSRNRTLTSGRAEHDLVVAGPTGRYLYFRANAVHPGVHEIWRHDLQERRNEQVTRLGGRVEAFSVSPDGTRLLVRHSTAMRPPELFLQPALPGATAMRLTHSVSEAFEAIDWAAPEFVEVPSSHVRARIHGRLYRPQGPAPAGGFPAVMFVHGAGYLQNAHQGWSTYFREFMFHTLLVRRGYVVLDLDYRASRGYGRDWRTAIYRHMGQPELEDLIDGVDWLVDEIDVDPQRVGIYGGSYGGFMTFMALFKAPGRFAAGAALRPVTDWRHYNHGYTSRILNTPEVDPEAFRRSSPIEFVDGLADPLLIAHGMLDDNVLYKDSVRLVQRLIELGKADWEFASYPVERHGFRTPSSWHDEYRRILTLFETHVRRRSDAGSTD